VILNFGEGYMRSKRSARRVKNRLDFAMMFGGDVPIKLDSVDFTVSPKKPELGGVQGIIGGGD
jgi:hypothetical protein